MPQRVLIIHSLPVLHSAGIEEAEFLKSVLVRVSSQLASFREEGTTPPERLEDLERFKEKCLAQRAEAEMVSLLDIVSSNQVSF